MKNIVVVFEALLQRKLRKLGRCHGIEQISFFGT